MADGDAPARSGGKGLSWKNPGWKEYAIVFGAALGGLWLWNHLSGSKTASTPASGTSSSGGSSPTGLPMSSFMLWIHDHQGTGGSGKDSLYYHSDPKHGQPYFDENGQKVKLPSGPVQIRGAQYYYHAAPKKGGKGYFTLNGKKVDAPSGLVTP